MCYLPQVAGESGQDPSCEHCISSTPFRVYPKSQVTVADVCVPLVDKLIPPLDGEAKV